jgi:hypothetical protein
MFFSRQISFLLKYGRQAAILEHQLSAIDPKLCTYVPLGRSNSSLILGLATRGPKTDNWIISKFLS